MTFDEQDKVIGHALDHVSYRWAKGLPVRHDRREWTKEEIELYNKTYDDAIEQKAHRKAKGDWIG